MDTQNNKPQFSGSQFWNERFGREEYVYGLTPNTFFKETIDQLPIGKILLPAEGEGRNAVYAAKLGWEVYALDFSSAAKAKAMKLAQENQVTIHYDLVDLAQFTTDIKFDLIGWIFLHLGPDEQKSMFQKYTQFLKPGGKLVLELYNKKQLGQSSGGPQNLDYLIDAAELETIFQDLQIDYLTEVEAELNEGPFHSGLAYTCRMIATKK